MDGHGWTSGALCRCHNQNRNFKILKKLIPKLIQKSITFKKNLIPQKSITITHFSLLCQQET